MYIQWYVAVHDLAIDGPGDAGDCITGHRRQPVLDSQKLKPDAEVQRAAIERHRFQPGRSGNPGGRPKGVIYPAEWMARLVNVQPAELRAVLEDEKTTVSKRIAILQLLDAAGASVDDDIKVGDRRAAAADIMDRTTGKATQNINVQGDGVQPTLVQIIDGKAPRAVEAKHIDALPDKSEG